MLNHNVRSRGIGGSEIAAILGLDSYRSPLDVWREKMGLDESFQGNEHTIRGSRFEPIVAEYLQDWLNENYEGSFVINPNDAHNEINPSGAYRIDKDKDTLIHPTITYFVGSPDRYVTMFDGELAGAELKTTLGIVKDYDDVCEKHISWILQSQYYMMLTGRKKWFLAWISAPFDFHCIELLHSQEMEDYIIEQLNSFWYNHILANTPPDTSNYSDVLKTYRPPKGGVIQASDETIELLNEYRELIASEKEIQARKLELKDRLACIFGNFDALGAGDNLLATFKEQKTIRIDTDLLKSEYSEVYEKVLKTSVSRVLRLKKYD